MLRLAQYFKQHPNRVLLHVMNEKDFKERTLRIVLYTDADLAGDPRDRRSIEGGVVFILGKHGTFACVSWWSKGMTAIATSTGEAEVRALFVGNRRLIGISMLLDLLLGYEVELRSLCDSRCAIEAVGAGYSKAMRYAKKTQGVSLSWLHEQAKDILQHCGSLHMAADVLTKGVHKVLFDLHSRFIGQVHIDDLRRVQCACTGCNSAAFGTMRCKRFVDSGHFCEECCTGERAMRSAQTTCECGCWYHGFTLTQEVKDEESRSGRL
jgi:hypothetical protein